MIHKENQSRKKLKKTKKKKRRKGQPVSESDEDIPVMHVVSTAVDVPEVRYVSVGVCGYVYVYPSWFCFYFFDSLTCFMFWSFFQGAQDSDNEEDERKENDPHKLLDINLDEYVSCYFFPDLT